MHDATRDGDARPKSAERATTVGRRCRLARIRIVLRIAATATILGGNTGQHLLDVQPAAGVGGLTAFLALHASTHGSGSAPRGAFSRGCQLAPWLATTFAAVAAAVCR